MDAEMIKAVAGITIFVILVIVVVLAVLRKMKERGLYNRASSLHTSGQDVEALALLLKAEQKWCFNIANATPKAFVKDLRRLKNIAALAQEIAAAHGHSIDNSGMQSAIQSLVNLYLDSSNFKFGTHTLKSDKASAEQQFQHQLELARDAFRQQLESAEATLSGVAPSPAATPAGKAISTAADGVVPGSVPPEPAEPPPQPRFRPTSGLPYWLSIILVVLGYALITGGFPGITQAIWLVPIVIVLGIIISALLETIRGNQK